MDGFVRTVVWLALILGAIGGILYLTVVDVWVVPADDAQLAVSIEPVLSVGDVLLLRRNGTASGGQLARCLDPAKPEHFVVGRVFAVAGETVLLQKRQILVDKKTLPRLRGCTGATLKNPANGEDVEMRCSVEDTRGNEHPTFDAKEPVSEDDPIDHTVSTGKLFLLSDDRSLHQDSRDFGELPEESCRQILGRFWSAGGWSDDAHRFNVLW